MSGAIEEDTELRDLVTQALENNGLLGKIQAQLRAGVFHALEDTDKKTRKVHHNKRLQQFLSSKDGMLAAGLVLEFLDFFQLDYTAAVFEPECGMTGKYAGRAVLEKQVDFDVSEELPLIATAIKQGSIRQNVNQDSNNTKTTISSAPSVDDPINDSMDFFNKKEPIDDMLNKYANNKMDSAVLSPPYQYKEAKISPATSPTSEQISEQISEHISEDMHEESTAQLSEDMHSDKAWEKEMKHLDDKLDNIQIKTPCTDQENKYEEDFEKTTSGDISGLSDIDDILQTSEKATDKGGEESMFTSDHTISVDSVGDVDYVEDLTF